MNHMDLKRKESREAYARGEERTLLLDVHNPYRGLTVGHRNGSHKGLQQNCPICGDES